MPVSSPVCYVEFDIGPSKDELRDSVGHRATFSGRVIPDRGTMAGFPKGVNVDFQIRSIYLLNARTWTYQVEGVAVDNDLFREGEVVVFDFNTATGVSERIYLS